MPPHFWREEELKGVPSTKRYAMFEMSHIVVLSQHDFVAREVSNVLSGRGLRAFALRLPFSRRARGG